MFPTKSFPKLWHVGTMDTTHKRNGSFEGAGLSVSTHPEAWRRIARGHVTGPTWILTKPGNKFLDHYRLTEAQSTEIAKWAVQNGYAETATLYRVSHYDDELESEVYTDYHTREEAEYEADEESPIKEIVGGLVGTDSLHERTRTDASPVMVADLLSTLYAEDVLGLDGVWWNDKLSPEAYSAPRGVIFQSKVKEWSFVKKVDESAQSTVTLYHVCLTRSLPRILENGLAPRIGPRSKRRGEKKPAIYFFPDLETLDDALSNWLGDEFSESAKLALLKVQIPHGVEVKSDVEYERHIHEPVPPDHITVLTRDIDSFEF